MVQQHGQQSCVDLHDVADVSEIDFIARTSLTVDDLFRRTSFGVHDVAVHARQADGFDAAMAERCQDVGIDLAGKDHLRHFERRVVCDTTALDDGLFDPEPRGEFAKLFAATVDDADAYADLVQ